MHVRKPVLVTILLAAALVAAGCTASNAPQAAAPAVVQPAASATAGAPAVATAGAEVTQVAPPTVSGAGGLVIAIDPANSEARYRVREQLAGHDLPNDAIGKTRAISGSVTIHPDGTIDQAGSKFSVNLSTLQSDRSMRDNFLRRSVLQTGQFPNATFVPTQVSGLSWPLPQSGPVTFQLTGDLTIRDVTKPVTWDVTGEIQDGQAGRATGLAKTSFTFADFNLEQPRVQSVLSIEDHITLEMDVALQPAAQ